MTPNLDRPTTSSSLATHPHPQTATTSQPSWWRGDQAHFEALVETRTMLHRHDSAMATKAQSVLMTTLVTAVSVYSVDAIGAVTIPAGPGFLVVFCTLLFLAMVAWLIDRRLVQQLNDLDLRSQLWLDLVDAIKDGDIDPALLRPAGPHESEVERFLRKEAAVAARFLTSETKLAPHLPIFGNCFTLENA